ncbi:MAG TPA: SIS domain-containing protein [Candidatus Acidoferrales bacterium]|nr:SIS domain-containing protein [Candidatus Acidoferrales bacterium]
MTGIAHLTESIARLLTARNEVCRRFFDREAPRLAGVCCSMAARFRCGGRLLAFGRGPYATDAQHVSVEFLHPVIVGKRALPAMDLSPFFDGASGSLIRPADIVMGFGAPGGDPEVAACLAAAHAKGAMTFALPGAKGDYFVEHVADDPFVHQEAIEILYHTLWESVHVFLEHEEVASEAGAASFLYPFLGSGNQAAPDLRSEVADSIRAKVREDAHLRERVAAGQASGIGEAIRAIGASVLRGGKLLIFGNGGSATDANDLAYDCLCPPGGLRPVPAVSLASEPAVLTAIANDVGIEAIFLRQIIAHARPEDTVIGISTSGGSRNLLAGLEEARRIGCTTLALLGYDGGEVVRRRLADFPIVVPCDYIPRIQEVQASIYHVMRESLGTLLDEP